AEWAAARDRRAGSRRSRAGTSSTGTRLWPTARPPLRTTPTTTGSSSASTPTWSTRRRHRPGRPRRRSAGKRRSTSARRRAPRRRSARKRRSTEEGSSMRVRKLLTVLVAAVTAATLCFATAAQASPGSLRGLLVETQGASEFGSFITALNAKPGVATVDDFNGFTGTPSAATLAGYDLIVSTGDSVYQDPALYGNRLADYIDAGGPVIQFAYDN